VRFISDRRARDRWPRVAKDSARYESLRETNPGEGRCGTPCGIIGSDLLRGAFSRAEFSVLPRGRCSVQFEPT